MVSNRSLRFGAAGWRMILISTFLYFAYAGWCVDGINIFASTLATQHGWSAGTLLSLVAPGGLMGVVGSAVFGQWIIRRGARWVMAITLACMALVVYWFGRMNTLWEFTLVFMLLNFFGAGFGFIAPGTLLAHWFPRRKGMALAIATCGYPLATAAFVPLIAAMFGRLGVPVSSLIWAVILVCAAAAAWFVVRNAPEELGINPDGAIGAGEERAQAGRSDLAEYTSPWTVKRLLKDRDQWLVSVGWGCLWMVTVGIVVQLVPRLEQVGFTTNEAIAMLSGAAVVALPGSIIWGFLDQRFGTRAASAAYGLTYIGTLCLLIGASKSRAVVFATVALVGLGLGGIKSLITSMTASVYGRYDFSAAYRVIIPVAIIVRTLCFPIMGLSLARSGNFSYGYMAFIAVDLVALVLIYSAPASCKGYRPA